MGHPLRDCPGCQCALGLVVLYTVTLIEDAKNEKELSERLLDAMLRRLKTEVLKDLPSLTRIKIPVVVGLGNHDTEVRNVRETSGAMQSVMVSRRLAGLTKMKIARELGQEMLDQNPESKIVFYCVHKDVVSYLAASFAGKCLRIVGDVPTKDRQKIIKRWQTDPHFNVMIISKAGGEGINLFSEEYDASRMIFVEREWTPAAEEQAEARLHRIGQEYPVEIYYLILQGTVDPIIDEVIEEKRKLADSLVRVNQVDVQNEVLRRMK